MNPASKYIDLATVGTNYAKRMNRLSNKIFGEVTRETNSKSMKVVKLFSAKPVEKSPEIVEYYPRLQETDSLMKHLRLLGLYRDEHEDFKDEMERLRTLRGKPKLWSTVKELKKEKKDKKK
ncbi:small ribosomal subunit protein mS33 [Prorops nasuta]|uniref:small ribosomal subunit protein mS33 n=1 Tax=Prorops nasuta TaxID=863751 RepID=UPI0034CDD15C